MKNVLIVGGDFGETPKKSSIIEKPSKKWEKLWKNQNLFIEEWKKNYEVF